MQAARKGLTKPFCCLASPPFDQQPNQGPALLSGSATKSKPELRRAFLSSQLPELAAASFCCTEQAPTGREAAPPASPRSGSHGFLRFDTSRLAKGFAPLRCCRVNSAQDQLFPSRAVTHHRALQPALSFQHSSSTEHVHAHYVPVFAAVGVRAVWEPLLWSQRGKNMQRHAPEHPHEACCRAK